MAGDSAGGELAGVFSVNGRSGKVRDVFSLPATAESGPRVAIVASDRISAFDVVLPDAIPGKGEILTRVAAFWLEWIAERGLCKTHLVSTDARDVPDEAFAIDAATGRQLIEGRVTIGRACEVLPVECVVRGYLEGSGWREYTESGTVCGVKLPAGLDRCDELPEPIFTPATKADQGAHDENISEERAGEIVGAERVAWLRETSLAIYREAAAHALARGIIIADTKFEFGLPLGADGKPTGEEPILIDEALTPDSSRFWPADVYQPGRTQPSFDKQFVREHLEELVERGLWDKTAPGPELPIDVIEGTRSRYAEAADRLMSR
ncbi:MAG: phosphoribosylaminoimidazolesuccinocarboxamide synthase [Planctomycetota bacterium]